MPLLLRTVEPIHVSRGTLPERFPVPNDLEAVANGTLSNIIRQLSSLSHYAEELFMDLINVGGEIANRASNLQARIDRLAVRVGQIDSMQDESSLQDSLHTKPFTSSLNFNQQVVARASLPPAMEKRYQLCDKPPPLEKLNVYRDDGKDGLKFYTDPSYFFDLWRQEMLKDTERAMDKTKKPHKLKNDGQNRHKKRVRQPNNTRERQRHMAVEHGELLMPTSGSGNSLATSSPVDGRDTKHFSTPPDRGSNMPRPIDEDHNNEYEYNRYMASMQQSEVHQRPLTHDNFEPSHESPVYRNGRNVASEYRPSQPPPTPPANNGGMNSNVGYNPGGATRITSSRVSTRDVLKVSRNALPPPPPLPREESSIDSNGAFPPPLDEENHDESMFNAFIPMIDDLPLPPPPPDMDDELLHALAPQLSRPSAQQQNKEANKAKITVRDGRSELLQAIRGGIELRKVETVNDNRISEKPSGYQDVASILARRVAVEMSDSDSGSSDYDSDGWDETNA